MASWTPCVEPFIVSLVDEVMSSLIVFLSFVEAVWYNLLTKLSAPGLRV